MMLCLLNGTLTAGSETILDILMNAVGLIVLNDLDNIIATIFVFNTGIDGQHEDCLLIDRDRQFGMAFSIPHIIWVFFYSLFFLGVYQGEQPVTVFDNILLAQSIVFPFIFLGWYAVCFAKPLEGCRTKIFGWLFDEDNNKEFHAMEARIR